MVPELDPFWVIAYWVVRSLAIAVSVWARNVVVSDWRETRHSALVPAAELLVSRSRLDAPAHTVPPVAALRAVRPRDARPRRPVT